MITNKGKTIIGKYMLGQTSSYAAYIAVGCGQVPLTTGDPHADYSAKENLEFEMFRVPISSRGFVHESGVDKIVFTAEIPTEERYEITEVGLYSAGANPSAGAFDSKNIFAFTQGENWNYHTVGSSVAIPQITVALDEIAQDNIIATTELAFQTNADNPIFFNANREVRYERPRFLNNIIMLRGDDADLDLSVDSGPTLDHFVINAGSNHIHLTAPNIDFTKNAPTDEMRLAFSLINKDGDSVSLPETVRILVDFTNLDDGTGEYARFEAEVNHATSGVLPGTQDFETNRYFVVSKQLQDMYVSSNFTWSSVNVVRIFACVVDGGVPSGNYYVALDALRLENVASVNPLYGLTGYSVVQNTTASTIVKNPNTSNYIEFRFSIGVT